MTTSMEPLKGVDRYGAGWRCRMRFPEPVGRYTETGLATVEAANQRILELGRLKRDGLFPAQAPDAQLLKQAAAALLTRKRVTGKRRKLTSRGVEYWERSLKPWLEGDHADTPLPLLRRDTLEDAILARSLATPTSARNERQALIALLEYAGERGHQFDLAILKIPPVILEPRERRALTAAELEWFASRAPDYGRRIILCQGTIGNRIGELFASKPDHADLDAARLFVPAANCKERRDKTIPLMGEEVTLLREQIGGLHLVTDDETSPTRLLPSRPAGAVYTFTSKTGVQWRHSMFDRLVWSKAVKRAAADWRDKHGLAEKAATPFEWYVDPSDETDDGRRWITTHDLRSTAVTLMRDAGVSREDCAARIGHADGGELIDAIYDKGDRTARVAKALAEAAPDGLRAALGGAETGPGRRATSPAAAGPIPATRKAN